MLGNLLNFGEEKRRGEGSPRYLDRNSSLEIRHQIVFFPPFLLNEMEQEYLDQEKVLRYIYTNVIRLHSKKCKKCTLGN